MASGPEAESSPHDEGLSALVRRIQIGDQTAIQAFHSMFLPGIEFLLRRKLEKSTVAAEAARQIALAHAEVGRCLISLPERFIDCARRPSAAWNRALPTQLRKAWRIWC